MDEWMNTYKQQEDHPKFPHILHNQMKMLEIIRLNSVENFPPENAHADFIPLIHAVSIYCMLPGNPAAEGSQGSGRPVYCLQKVVPLPNRLDTSRSYSQEPISPLPSMLQ